MLGRMAPVAEGVNIMPTLTWEKPLLGCAESLRQSSEVRTRVPQIERILHDVWRKMQEVRYAPECVAQAQRLDDDELTGILIYTHDLRDGKTEGNLYFEENKDLRLHDANARLNAMKKWSAHMYYTLCGLSKLPDYTGQVYRGLDDPKIHTEYKQGRRICWGAWSSCTTLIKAAEEYAGKSGVVLIIQVSTGKHLNYLSCFPDEGEVLLSPRHEFYVMGPVYEQDGIRYLHLTEATDLDCYRS